MSIFRLLIEDTLLLVRNLNHGTSLINESLCQRIADGYCNLTKTDKTRYLLSLALEHGLNKDLQQSPSKLIASKKSNLSSYDTIFVKLPSSLPPSNWMAGRCVEESDNWEETAESHVEALQRAQTARFNLTPRYHDFFLTMSRLPMGVRWLVDMRADLGELAFSETALSRHTFRGKALQMFNEELKSLLSIWFSHGLMDIQRITWESSARLLDKLATYEAVHPLRSWLDLRRRVGPYRRCFVFTHPCLPGEPVVILHVALTQSILGSMNGLVQQNMSSSTKNPFNDILQTNESTTATAVKHGVEDLRMVRAANFYSITAPHAGLQGIDLGNNLIKRVTSLLKTELPALEVFTTLSPVPGFTKWLFAEINRHLQNAVIERIVVEEKKTTPTQEKDGALFRADEAAQLGVALGTGASTKDLLTQLRLRLQVPDEEEANFQSWTKDAQLTNALRTPLMMLCARYLYTQKLGGYALDPVANFHLRNGAVIYRLNWLANCSLRGLRQSCGIMVNYRYYADRTNELAEQYADQRIIQLGDDVSSILEVESSKCQPDAKL